MNAPNERGFFSRLFKSTPKEILEENRPTLVFDVAQSAPDYFPDMAAPCFCGSDKFFKSCCGSMEEKRLPPYGVFIFRNYLDRDYLKKFRSYADAQVGERLMVIDSELSTPGNIVKKVDDRRVSESVELKEHFDPINAVIKQAFTEIPPKYFKRNVEWYERPNLMRYYPGGFYQGHADSENLDPQTRVWQKVIDRDLSLLLYLNDDFEGGDLFFNKFNFRLRPEAGMLVMFPSDNRYMHTAEIVEDGVRYAVVSWASVKQVQKVAANPPESIIQL